MLYFTIQWSIHKSLTAVVQGRFNGPSQSTLPNSLHFSLNISTKKIKKKNPSKI